MSTGIGYQVIDVMVHKLNSATRNDQMLRTCATTALGLMKNRIHEQGKDAEGKQIGTYSKPYMKVRTGNYGNAGKVSRGKNKGKLKDAGVFSKGKNKGAPRPRYNRTTDTKVIGSLTRQMENDIKVVAIKAVVYGIGYSNSHNYNKSQFLEKTYKREGKIFSLSADEQEAIQNIAKKFIQDAIS